MRHLRRIEKEGVFYNLFLFLSFPIETYDPPGFSCPYSTIDVVKMSPLWLDEIEIMPA